MTDQTQRQTLQQKRAASAWQQVSEVDSMAEKTRKEYGSLVRGLPAMIQTDGLAQTLAFLLAKAEGKSTKPHAIAYRHLSDWLPNELDVSGDLLEWIVKQDSNIYRMTAATALAYLHWLKRFAESKGWRSDDEGSAA